jgi:hypothetical protein
MTSIERELNRPVPVDEVSSQVIAAFGRQFDLQPATPTRV